MKTNEIMIGDWVKYSDKEFKVFMVIGEFAYLVNSKYETIVQHIRGIKPIPISMYNLVLNGFKNGQFFGELVIDGFQVQCDGHNLRVRTKETELLNIKCEYVHELQHALRICGINKEIEL